MKRALLIFLCVFSFGVSAATPNLENRCAKTLESLARENPEFANQLKNLRHDLESRIDAIVIDPFFFALTPSAIEDVISIFAQRFPLLSSSRAAVLKAEFESSKL